MSNLWERACVWRGSLLPLGREAAPKSLRLLRSRAGASSLATQPRSRRESHTGAASSISNDSSDRYCPGVMPNQRLQALLKLL